MSTLRGVLQTAADISYKVSVTYFYLKEGEEMKYFLLCWRCGHPHDAARYKVDEHNVECDECSGPVVTNSGKVQVARVEDLPKLFDMLGHQKEQIEL